MNYPTPIPPDLLKLSIQLKSKIISPIDKIVITIIMLFHLFLLLSINTSLLSELINNGTIPILQLSHFQIELH